MRSYQSRILKGPLWALNPMCVCVCKCVCVCVHVCTLLLSRVQLFAAMNYSLPGSSVHGIFQARLPFPPPRIFPGTRISCVSCIGSTSALPLYHYITREAQSNTTCVLLRREETQWQIHTGSCDNGDRDCWDVSASHGTSRTAHTYRRLGKGKQAFFPRTLRGSTALATSWF